MHRLRLSIVAVSLAAGTIFFAGCDEHVDKLNSIAENPNSYSNKTVQVAGEVTKVYELPLGITNLAAYRITDGSGQIWVLSHAGAPREGDKIGIQGRVRPEGRLGGMSLGAVIEEQQRRMK